MLLPLFSELELSFFRSKPRNLEFRKNSWMAPLPRRNVPPPTSTTASVEQRRHANNISRVLSPPTVLGCSTFTELYRRHAPGVKQQLLA
jgi:hypothetical protein